MVQAMAAMMAGAIQTMGTRKMVAMRACPPIGARGPRLPVLAGHNPSIAKLCLPSAPPRWRPNGQSSRHSHRGRRSVDQHRNDLTRCAFSERMRRRGSNCGWRQEPSAGLRQGAERPGSPAAAGKYPWQVLLCGLHATRYGSPSFAIENSKGSAAALAWHFVMATALTTPSACPAPFAASGREPFFYSLVKVRLCVCEPTLRRTRSLAIFSPFPRPVN